MALKDLKSTKKLTHKKPSLVKRDDLKLRAPVKKVAAVKPRKAARGK